MHLSEETIYTNKQLLILDADCKKEQTIVLLKGKGENIVQLNGETIFTGPTGHHKIRFTKEHFCLLSDSTLSFYKLNGEFVSECDIGTNVFELFPYRQGVLCILEMKAYLARKWAKTDSTTLHLSPNLNPILRQLLKIKSFTMPFSQGINLLHAWGGKAMN